MSIASTTPAVRRVRHAVRTRISEHPAVYLRFARKKYPGPSPEVIGADTELVIDGYTRSASTFAVYALQLAQRRPIRLAHHLHAPAQLIEAARRRVPALLLVREPRSAILSQLVREPEVALRDALVAYARFHACLMPHLDRMVVADFETVTHDLGSVIRRLNSRFGMSLEEFIPTEANTSECFEFIEQRGSLSPVLLGFESGTVGKDAARRELHALQQRMTQDEMREAWVPSEQRNRAKDALAEAWAHPELITLRVRADDIYRRLLSATEDAYAGLVDQ